MAELEPSVEQSYFRDARSREQFRAERVAQIPPGYSPRLHWGATLGIGALATAFAVAQIHALRPVELLAVPAMFVLANFAEWVAHRNLLHRRRKPIQMLYDQHTPEHHRIFRYGDMAMRSAREYRLVLLPSAGVALIVVIAAPFAALVGGLLTRNAGYLTLLTSVLYVIGYEVTHLSYHLPRSSWVHRIGVLGALSEHHARHHDPRLMQKWNFNVTVPLADWVFGTIASAKRVDAASSERPRPR